MPGVRAIRQKTSAYMSFKVWFRKRCTDEERALSRTAFAKITKAAWKKAPRHVVAECEAIAAARNKRYYRTRQKLIDNPRPRKNPAVGVTPYNLFVKKRFQQLMKSKNLDFYTTCREIAAIWRAMTPEDKRPFEIEAEDTIAAARVELFKLRTCDLKDPKPADGERCQAYGCD